MLFSVKIGRADQVLIKNLKKETVMSVYKNQYPKNREQAGNQQIPKGQPQAGNKKNNNEEVQDNDEQAG